MINRILITIKKIIPSGVFRRLQPVYHWLMNFAAAVFYRFPSEKLIVVGVTGTTGKTTVVYLIAQMLSSAGIKTGYTSTALFGDGSCEWLNDSKMTMLGRFQTQKMLRQMVKNGCCVAVVETTSEGIKQFRHRFINYDICVFTGIYPEHIESHGSFENYKAAKLKLFEHLSGCRRKKTPRGCSLKKRIGKTIIVNADDEYAEEFLDFPVDEKISVRSPEAEQTLRGLEFDLPFGFVKLKLRGKFNALNAALAAAVGKTLGLDDRQIIDGLEKVENIPGRLEKIEDPKRGFAAIVDYAFEPVALEKLYETVEIFRPKRIIHVLGGTGGGRDRARRKVMGRLAGNKADLVVITDEDPYDEDPRSIIDEVFAGVVENQKKKEGENCWRIDNRAEAIRFALTSAQEGDLVLITGKGCERGIVVADGRQIPHDDRQVVRDFIAGK